MWLGTQFCSTLCIYDPEFINSLARYRSFTLLWILWISLSETSTFGQRSSSHCTIPHHQNTKEPRYEYKFPETTKNGHMLHQSPSLVIPAGWLTMVNFLLSLVYLLARCLWTLLFTHYLGCPKNPNDKYRRLQQLEYWQHMRPLKKEKYTILPFLL